MNDRMKVIKEVALRADRSQFNSSAAKLGKVAASAFGMQHKTQMKNLENIANSALTISDVLNFIKRQTGKSSEGKTWKIDDFGKSLIDKIETDIKKDRDLIVRNLRISSDEQKLDVYLLLVREFIRQLVIHYEYSV